MSEKNENISKLTANIVIDWSEEKVGDSGYTTDNIQK